MTTTYIYGLVDPRDDCIRYVGKANDPRGRLSRHLYKTGPFSDEHKQKISRALKGKPFSQEHRQSLVEAWKNRRARMANDKTL